MSDKKTVSLRLTPEVYAAVKKLAKANERSVEGQVRALVNQALRKSK